ncbi:polysaccharide deacetylase family protein [Paenibacillus psychroresistens]|uniref:Polysaccharide deacetylase family protein n=2 Tax=Paenibacillus psychroresistens TaxID=1778678 RepID=A0A6B8S024_9BACL|nr:polysaccharide deacetylase family protein [Paenibacillus psychroresistens]
MTGTLSHAQEAPLINKNRYYYEKRGDIVWEVPNSEKIIALTFDDGPDPEDTPTILDLLAQYQVKATFFVVGKKVDMYPELAKREVFEGHELANHTYNHLYINKRMTEDSIHKEILKAEQTIINTTGFKPHLFRPPGGFYSENLIHVLQKTGYQMIMWSWHQDSKDWNRPGVDRIVSSVIQKTRNGDIVLLHDYVEGETQTIEALKQILPQLKAKGYRFVTVSELLTYRKTTTVKK